MRRFAFAGLVTGSLLTAAVASAQPAPSAPPAAETAPLLRDAARAALLRDVRYLASRALGGRGIGSPGLDSAALFLARQYRDLQIDALLRDTPCDTSAPCPRTYFQTFRPPVRSLEAARADPKSLAHNVVAFIRGTDPALGGQWIVIGAHYDHLGVTGLGAADRTFARSPHLGADDNASGTAVVLELARRLANDPPRRPVMFVHFSAEEIGLVGSSVFVEVPPVAMDSVVAMFNFDMVGQLDRRKLQLIGLESSPDWKELIARANVAPTTPVTEGRVLGGSDHMPFALVGVPSVHIFTGMHARYHTKNDVVESLDIDGMVTVVEFAERLIRLVANDEVPPRRVRPH